jgi:hypothetical protein
LDISNAFLYGTFQEDVYMAQPKPKGFVVPEFPDYFYKLDKAIYCLKQAPHASFHRFPESLIDFGFVQTLVDTKLFLFHQGVVHLFLLVYVDNILVTRTHVSFIASLLAKLRTDFFLKDLSELNYFLGIQVHREPSGLHMRQSKYIVDLLQKAKMVGA